MLFYTAGLHLLKSFRAPPRYCLLLFFCGVVGTFSEAPNLENTATLELKTMRAVVYNGPRDVSIDNIDDARIEKPTDAIIRVTTTNICGSDLHMYEGRTDFEKGSVFGHENLGLVVEVGAGVDRVK